MVRGSRLPGTQLLAGLCFACATLWRLATRVAPMEMSKSILLATALALYSSCVAAQPSARPEEVGLDPTRLARAGDVLEGVIASQTSGSAVGLIARDGRIVFQKAYGELGPGTPMPVDAIARMASIGKTITAVAIMQLVEEGKVRLSDPVTRFIPDFLPRQVRQPDGHKGRRSPPKRAITVYDLLTHQSGLAVSGKAVDELWDTAPTTLAFSKGIAKLPLQWQPGEGFEYGHGYEVLAAVIEKASGVTLDQYLHDKILMPLGMTDTSFRVPPEKRHRYAGVYQKREPSTLTLYRRNGEEEAPTRYLAGGGGLRGTVQDYFRFAQMLLNQGELGGIRILSPKSIELITRNHVSEILLRKAGWDEYGWGLGVSVRTSLQSGGLGSVGAFGWNGGTGTLYLVDPREALIVVVFIHSQPGTPGVSQRRDDFVNAAYQAIVGIPAR